MTAPIRYMDLFCGLGAFHTAFPSPAFECVLACDIDEGVRTIYAANYGIEPKEDIRSLTSLPDCEILCAGFPCQPFSIAGNGAGFTDPEKGNLFYEILKILDAKRPPMCILENVKNLKTHDGGKTYTTIETELKRRNYQITSKILNAADYGSPQARQRIFLVATQGRPFTIPEGKGPSTPVSRILDKEPQAALDLGRYTLTKKATKATVPGKPKVLSDLVSKTSCKGGRQGERVYSTDSVGITVCASSGGPGAKTGLYQVGDTIRRLTVSETLKMFGFPPSYRFPDTVSHEDALFYLGNSIVVDVIRAIVPAVRAWFEAR